MPTTSASPVQGVAAPAGGNFLIEDAVPEQIFVPEDFDETHRQVRTTASRFMREEVLPKIPDMERKEPGVARALIDQAAELGLLGILVPERYDGLELDLTTQMLVAECIGGYASFSTTYGAHAGIGTLPIELFGTESQMAKYLPRLVKGELLAAYCLSEPQAGSDSLASLTRAERTADGRHYVLNGQKMWISNGGWADLFTVFAKVDGERFTAFLVERSWEGVRTGAEEHKMGLLGSSTTALYLDNVKVPAENVLGEVGRGHIIAFNVLNLGRLELGASCVGGAKDLILEAAGYAKQRKAFGQPIAQFGAIRQKLADMAARTFAGESLIYRTSGMIDARLADLSWDAPDAAKTVLKAVEEYAIECSIGKVYLSETLDFVADEAVQIHGGYGYHRDYSVERGYRDSRINRIYEGTNEINRLLTTGMLLKRAAQGRLALLAAIKSGESATDAPAPWEAPYAFEGVLVGRAKRGTLTMAGLAYRRFGAELERHQEVAAAISDMVMGVYAAESALLRARKLEAGRRSISVEDLVAVIVQRTMRLIQDRGHLILGACSEGEELDRGYIAFDRLTETPPINLPVAHDRIAARLLEAGGYCW